jgi:protein-disulfide isomerase
MKEKPMSETNKKPSRWLEHLRATLDVVASVAIVLLAVLAVGSVFKKPGVAAAPQSNRGLAKTEAVVPSTPVSIQGAATLGNANAHLAIVEYSDFQCPFCAAFAKDTFPKLRATYIDKGKLLFVFKHMPLSSIHKSALGAARAAACAGKQGKFWEMHDALFDSQESLDLLRPIALSAGLRLGVFDACLRSKETLQVEADVASAASLGISGTPTFLVGTRESSGVKVAKVLRGTQTFEQIESLLSSLSDKTQK